MQSIPSNNIRSSSSSSKTKQSLIKKPFKFKFALCDIKDEEDKNKRITRSDHRQLRTMATLHRFKLLATQCGVTQSPTRSPRTSPVVHLRRRRSSLRSMILGRRGAATAVPPRRRDSVDSLPDKRIEKNEEEEEEEEEKALVKRNSLKELFGSSSPPWEVEGACGGRRSSAKENREGSGLVGVGLGGLRTGPGSPRPVWTGFRYRSLLRKAWRPVLVTIPE